MRLLLNSYSSVMIFFSSLSIYMGPGVGWDCVLEV